MQLRSFVRGCWISYKCCTQTNPSGPQMAAVKPKPEHYHEDFIIQCSSKNIRDQTRFGNRFVVCGNPSSDWYRDR